LQDVNGKRNNSHSALRFYSLLNVPLKIKDRIVGILGVKNYSEARIFSSSHLYQLSQLSNIAAAALENAQKYDHACTELAHYTHKY
jgi:GAF domain-containing protein